MNPHSANNVTPILLLEINEVPWRLIDRYLERPGYPHLREFFARAHQYTTVAVDTGELSPWVTWPTLHRGMNNEGHGIRNLGQDPRTFRGTPVWQEIRARGGTIGVFGSLQSWPPIDPGAGGFYVPDTFAPDERCIPESLSPLQAFNLEQVRRNARVVDRGIPGLARMAGFARDCLRAGVRVSTLARLAAQLVAERFDRAHAARRPVYQTVIFWDVFRRRFDALRPPAFSTFFTNHVAGVMHRYWRDVFPEDFPQASGDDASQERLMRFALEVLDAMLGDVLEWTRRNPELVVVFAASMGQGAVHRARHEGVELVVEDLARLMASCGLERADYQPLLAMVPQVAVRIADAPRRAAARERLRAARFEDGAGFVRVEENGDTLSITVHTPPLARMASGVVSIGGARLELGEAGIRRQPVEPGTGYHVPEGAFAVYAPRAPAPPAPSRWRVDADAVKDWLLAVSEAGHSQLGALAGRERA